MTIMMTSIDTPVGRLDLFASDDGVELIRWPDRPDQPRPDGGPAVVVDADAPPTSPAHRMLVELVTQLREYFGGERTTFDIPLAPRGTPFQLTAWQALRDIPYGATVSYGEQARRLGDPNKARAVGAANGRNPLPIVVPCHRVVGADGSLTGFGGGMDNKAWLLDHERGAKSLF